MGKREREKGKRGERLWASYCREQGYDVHRTAQYCGKTGDAADCIGLPGIHQEVKFVERLNIWDAMEQAKCDAEKSGEIPIVAHKKNYTEWLVTMKADDWFKLYREWESGLQREKENSHDQQITSGI